MPLDVEEPVNNEEPIADDEVKAITFPDGREAGFYRIKPLVDTPEPPTISETINASFQNYNSVVNAEHGIKRFAENLQDDQLNPFNFETPDGFESLTRESTQGIPQQYWPQLSKATNPAQLAQIRQDIFTEAEYDDVINRSGFFSGHLSLIAAGLLSPTTLIPVAAMSKYAKMSDNVFKNAARALPSMALSSALDNAVVDVNKQTRGIGDWAVETIADTIVGSTLVGGIGFVGGAKAGLTPGMLKSKIEAGVKGSMDGVDIKVRANPDGTFAGYEAVAGENSGGAMEAKVNYAQIKLDEGVAGIGESALFKRIFSVSPIVRGRTSDFATTRKFTQGFFKNNIVSEKIAGQEAGVIQASAEAELNFWRANTIASLQGVHDIWKEKVGLTGDYASVKQKLFSKSVQSEAEFKQQVAGALRRGDVDPDPHVEKAAKLFRKEVFDTTSQDLIKVGKLAAGTKPVTAISYLTKIWDKNKIALAPDEFITMLNANWRDANAQIKELTAGIDTHTQTIQALRNEYKALKYVPALTKEEKARKRLQRRAISDQLEAARDAKQLAKIELQEKIDKGEVDPMLTNGRNEFTYDEIQQIKQFQEPIDALLKEIKEAKRAKQKLGTLKAFEALETPSLVELGGKYLDGALQDLRELGKKKTLNRLKRYRNDAINEYNELSTEIRQLKESLKGTKTRTQSKIKDKIRGLEEDRALVKEERIARTKVLEGLRQGLSEKNITAEELVADVLEGRSLLNKVGSENNKAETSSARARIQKAARDIKDKEAALSEYQRLIEEHINANPLSNIVRKGARGNLKLAALDERNTLRKPIPDNEVNSVSEAMMETILQETEDQISSRVFSALSSGGVNPLKKRTAMVHDTKSEPWLVNDLDRIAHTYTERVGRVLGSEKFFQSIGGATGEDGKLNLINLLKDEYNEIKAGILAKPRTPERDQELAEWKKSFDDNVEFISDAHSVFMGNYGSGNPKLMQLSRNVRNYTMATMLGNVLLLSQVDVGNAIFKLGFKSFFKDGVAPVVRSLRNMQLAGKIHADDMADCGIGLNTASGAHLEQVWGGADLQTHPKTGATKFFENTAKTAGNLFLINPWNDLMQTIVGGASQSKTIRALKKYVSGTELTQTEHERLRLLSLDYSRKFKNLKTGAEETLAHRIVNQFDRFGKEENGGFVANFSEWQDFEASKALKISIQQEVTSTILQPNMLDIPFALRNPVISMMTQFMSYAFASTSHYTIPLLQRPDAQKAYGLLAMMTIGSMVGPMRQMARGEEPEFNSQKLLTEAIFNSGALGIMGDVLTKANSILDIRLLRPYQIDRFRKKTAAELITGPFVGQLQNAITGLTMFLNGEINEQDLKKTGRVVPFDGAFWLQGIQNNLIEGLGLPKNRAEARAAHGE